MPRPPDRLLAALAALAAAGAFAPPAHAQAQHGDTAPLICLGFAFGQWTPALDWRSAGHGAAPDTSGLMKAPADRDWATNGVGGVEDSVVILYPRWWPAGVAVTLSTRRPPPGDTIVGRAVALVADGRRANPVSRVRAWAVSCSGRR
jgi:hypothetical protein